MLLVIDKGLLTLAGGTIAFIAARALERYRRQQSVVLELGKLRAQAFARVLSAAASHAYHVDQLIAAARTNAEESDKIRVLGKAAMDSALSIQDVALREAGLIDRKTGKIIQKYLVAISEIDVERMKKGGLTEEEATNRKDNINELRDELHRFLPPLPRAD
ncbi:hypothetical protein [Myxococcus sp. CA040A]|uniref:hypothetical protein n=1 Tax=Myxococcus sp. CA040A TaxID=2741738 RepID=UPI001C2D9A04|nr:hypothetical protein [Myxococcus sp. CA040A]NTX07039.1 hypothetical protein [Myxococcus sp. CA040A]